jgi:acyl-coenzyme A synthetase/AMP-(fatty) acid ligase
VNIAHFKAPHSVTFIKELPKTATGKIQKYVLRDRARSRRSESTLQHWRERPLEWIC